MRNRLSETWQKIRSYRFWWVGLVLLLLIGGTICLTPFLFLAGGDLSYEMASAPVSISRSSDGADVAEMAPFEPELAFVDDSAAIDNVLANALAQAQQQSRLIIYTGNMSLVVKDTEDAVAAVTALTTDVGGYVSGSNIYQSGEVPRGSITIRVPADRYEETLAALRALAVRVEREQSNTQDITEEFTDLQARKSNLEAAEAALQDLLDKRERVGSTADILEVYRELTNIRGQIEQIEGRLRVLTNQAALSTITIELIPDVLYQPVQVAGWEPQGIAKEALQTLIVAFQGIGAALIWLVVFVLPLLIVVLIILGGIIWIIRQAWRWWSGRRPQPA